MRLQTNNNKNKTWMLVADDDRLPDPERFLSLLPPKSMVLLRSKNQRNLCQLAARVIPMAHKMGHLVLLAGPIRLALAMGADGAHLSEAIIRRGSIKDMAPSPMPKGFIISASAHGKVALIRAKNAGVDFVILGSVFSTKSHADTAPLRIIRFTYLAHNSPLPIVAIGGINKLTARRLNGAGKNLIGLAGIETFTTKN